MAYSSAYELAFQSTIAAELEFGKPADREQVAEHSDHVQRMLNRLMVAKRAGRTDLRRKPASRAGTLEA